jgi:RNA recognition motif-containing protein
MDLNMPRDKETGKPRGFGFLMYEDQRSTVLAVDNLNGAKILDKTLRVDHVKSYKQPKSKGEDGEWVEAEEPSFNAKPEIIGACLMLCVILGFVLMDKQMTKPNPTLQCPLDLPSTLKIRWPNTSCRNEKKTRLSKSLKKPNHQRGNTKTRRQRNDKRAKPERKRRRPRSYWESQKG